MRIQASLTADPLDVSDVIAAAEDPAAGAVVTFVGTVRETSSIPSSSGRDVVALLYEAHLPLAEQRLKDIATDAGERWTLTSAAVVHRLGRCGLGEPTVAIACSAPHRADAFASCRWIIERLKADVPIWKCEIYQNGEAWVGMGS